MKRRADLSPPLGESGGPCKVVERILDRAPAQEQRELIDTVEQDRDLGNPEASQVYHLITERGAHPFSQFAISPHAQYRMDLRGVTLKHLRESLARFVVEIGKWQRTRDPRLKQLVGSKEFEWVDPKSGLFFAFGMRGDTLVIITTYWATRSTPRMPPGGCQVTRKHAGHSAPFGEMAGVRTFVSEKPAKGIQDSLGDTIHHPPGESPKSDRERAAPQRTDTKENLTEHRPGPPVYNTPGPSVPMRDRDTRTPGTPGQSDKIRVRTPGTPGEEYGHPYKDNIYPRRTASEDDELLDKEAGLLPSYGERQHKQRGEAKRYYKRYYRKNKSKIKRRSKQKYRRIRNNPTFKRQRKLRNDPKYRNRFRRLNFGGAKSNKERSKRREAVLEFMDLDMGFYHPLFGWGDVVSLDVAEDKVVVHLDGEEYPTEIPVAAFAAQAVFDSDESLDAFFEELDETYEQPDPRVIAATFYRETFTPGYNLDPGDGVRDLGAPGPESPLSLHYPDDEHDDRKQSERPDYGQVDNNPGSAKVIPSGHDFVNKEADWQSGQSGPSAIRVAAKMAEIMRGCASDVISRARSLKPKSRRFNPANLFYTFSVPGSKGEPYVVRLKVIRPRANVADIHKMDLKVSCSCDFWRWQGPEYHAKSGDYLYGKPRGTATRPTEKDPRAKHRVCKHVASVLKLIDKWNLTPPRPTTVK